MVSQFKKILVQFLPFWAYLLFFKFGAGFHYTLTSPLGERVLPITLVGILIGGSAILQLILDIPAGYITDRYGRKNVLIGATIVFILAACFLVFFPLSPATFIISLFVSSLGWLFFGPGVTAYLFAHSSARNVGRTLSVGEICESLGIVIATLILPFLINAPSQVLGLIAVSILVIAIACIITSPSDSIYTHKSSRHRHHTSYRGFFKSLVYTLRHLTPASVMLLISGLSASMFYSIVWFVIPLVIAQGGHSKILGVGLSVFDFAVIVVGFSIGKLIDRGKQRLLIITGLGIFAIAGLMISFNLNILFLLLGFLATVGDEMSSLSFWAWLRKSEHNRDHDGMITSIISVVSDLGWGVGPMLAGILFPIVGAQWTLLIGGIFLCTTFIIYIFLYYRHHGPVATE